MKAQLIVNGVTVELSHNELNEIAFTLDTCERYMDLFHELAGSPCTETRSSVASQTFLHEKTCRILLQDNQVDVLRALTSKGRCIPEIKKEDIERLIDLQDTEILSNIINHISDLTEEYSICEKDWLCEKLYQQKDPVVRQELAENDETPRFILKKMVLNDSEWAVSKAAEETLALIEEYDDDDIEI
ncbi:hypothetical protein [Desulfotignum phosphitoxidans]|uniref:HEAT repeat domain-containing protein n=1 Tax=Desulfotignum phosphitoxidans DSM 13687 TaxID=1286635 RepID=S0G2N5_9BACT|nr:hypothetical protein [Desulfotignum phosphitoxidans]EMS78427.1 hypothetical protein Dpo_8c00940 [Desulfotignum phosphitoxidans DSM 13687]